MIPKTKIMATLGPASGKPAVLRKMFVDGLDAVRLNFSHGSHQSHIENINLVRALNKKMRRHVRIMQDLEGYRIRVGGVQVPVILRKRKTLYLSQDVVIGTESCVSFDYEGSLKAIKPGSLIYIDDGRIVLEVVAQYKRKLKTRVLVPGVLKSHKGINIPGVKLEFCALTDKDKRDVKVTMEYKLDYLAQSFVRNVKDLRLLKDIVLPVHSKCKFFAKIENKEALRNLDSIIKEADGIIVARGDLGICVPIYQVPVIQKDIVKRCRRMKKPVVVATQMLESMTYESLPTRAEVSDVANAILDGATHLMLSGETAVGKHPHVVIDMMNKVIKHTETYAIR
jgi:pyruvate kinase